MIGAATNSTVPLRRHLRERVLRQENQTPPKPKLAVPLVLFIAGPVAGALGLGYAAVAWHGDPLITYRGWVVVACTTFCALAVFVGESRWRHARAQQAAPTATADAIAEAVAEALVDAVARMLAEAEIVHARREVRILDAVEEARDTVKVLGARRPGQGPRRRRRASSDPEVAEQLKRARAQGYVAGVKQRLNGRGSGAVIPFEKS